jgi:hypothetical protein
VDGVGGEAVDQPGTGAGFAAAVVDAGGDIGLCGPRLESELVLVGVGEFGGQLRKVLAGLEEGEETLAVLTGAAGETGSWPRSDHV